MGFLMKAEKRILALDLLRGYLLFVIFSDNIYRIPSVFDAVTGRGQLWVSAAEGFFLVSGLLVGKLCFSPKKLLFRAGKLYVISIVLTGLFTLWGQHLPIEKIKDGLWAGKDLMEIFPRILTLKYVYGFADFLSFYCVYLVLAPIALFFLRRRKWWLVLVASFVFWFRNANQFFAWQILFFIGVVTGFHFKNVENFIRRYKKIIYIVSAVTILTSFQIVFRGWLDPIPSLFDKNTIGIGRLILSLIWFAAFYNFFKDYERIIDKVTGGVFLTLGKKSLLVYCLQAVIVFPLDALVRYPPSWIANSLLIFGLILALYLGIRVESVCEQKFIACWHRCGLGRGVSGGRTFPQEK